MDLRPQKELTEKEVKHGLRLIVGDGLASEAMTSLIGNTFLVAMAVLLGASNLQIGLLAALPTFTNIFQLVSIWLVRRTNNRRLVSVYSSIMARFPLIIIGILPLFFPSLISIDRLIFFLFFYYVFASIAGPSWNSWMKDLVPEQSLGAYFSHRSSYMQTLNVILSIILALVVDYVKDNYPQYELQTYGAMFAFAGIIGITGAFILSKAPEPQSYLPRENIFRLFSRPLKDLNFRRLLVFNSAWVFALNIATPFFVVFMLKGLGLSITYIIGLTITSQLCSILTVRIWGAFADRYSNKTIIAICAPLYIFCIIGWSFVGIYTYVWSNLILLVIIHIFSGIATAGINLSLTNIGLKLAPREDGIVYLSVKNIITAFFSSIAPLLGGILADYFAQRQLKITIEWTGPNLEKVFRLLSLHEWNFLFLIGAAFAFIAVQLLIRVKETGEVEKDIVVRIMRSSIKNSLKEYFIIGNLINLHDQIWSMIKKPSQQEEDSVSSRQ